MFDSLKNLAGLSANYGVGKVSSTMTQGALAVGDNDGLTGLLKGFAVGGLASKASSKSADMAVEAGVKDILGDAGVKESKIDKLF